MSSIPSTSHPRTFSIGSIKEYVIHCVSLWNGTRSSPLAAAERLLFFSPGENLRFSGTALGLDEGLSARASQGHTSPSATPLSDEREAGQIVASPSMRTPKRLDTWIAVLPLR